MLLTAFFNLCILAFVDAENQLYWDPSLTTPVTQVLYQKEGSPFLYLDEEMQIRLNVISDTGN